MAKPRRRRCAGKTKAGAKCQAWALRGATRCAAHPTDPTRKKARSRARDWGPAFLQALEETHMVTEAARAAGVHRSSAYDRRERDEAFAGAWADVEERSTEQLEREAFRRAEEGWTERQIFDDEGNAIGEVRKFSDTLLIFLLKARRPERYREQHRVEHVGAGGGPVSVRVDLDAKARKALGDVLRSRPATRDEN